MSSESSEYTIVLAEPSLDARTPDHLAEALQRAHERHLRDWIIEARRRAYEEFILAKFGQLINEIDNGLRTTSGASLWTDERYRIETTAQTPDRPTVRYCSSEEYHLTEADVEALQPTVRSELSELLESEIHEAVNGTLMLYSQAVATYSTRQLLQYVNTHNELYGVSSEDEAEESQPETAAVRTFELGDSNVTFEVQTEASDF
ncbi:hypothetical protein VB773_06580 [Haloarculaceae archaeon H-GB2-1]|nr:hypothetical protein [Haloarculaceae archaeon H-GB1-1]MEA5385765.1 hypothetical protein [Haloarculaceae archaeon H-GB11]MEA5407269.1 hypothetical protein [Haloarculaceae archaeon H-GB2-1]